MSLEDELNDIQEKIYFLLDENNDVNNTKWWRELNEAREKILSTLKILDEETKIV